MSIKKMLIKLGTHGKRHRISKVYINIKVYKNKQLERENKIIEFMKNNGLGA